MNEHLFSNVDTSFWNFVFISASVFQTTERCWLLPAHTCTRMWTIHRIRCQRTRFTSDTCQTKKQSPNRTKHIFRKHQTIQFIVVLTMLILGHLFDTFSCSLLCNTRPYVEGVHFSHFIRLADKKIIQCSTKRENPSSARILNITIFNLVAPSTTPHVDDL